MSERTATEATAVVGHGLTPRERRQRLRQQAEPATETAKNSRIRNARRDAWRHAGRVTEYWRARMDWEHALETAQQYGIAASGSFPSAENDRIRLVEKWREAVVKQLLTPAPDVAAITWKRAKLAGREFSHLPIKKERVEQAIADDIAFLASHPTRRKIVRDDRQA